MKAPALLAVLWLSACQLPPGVRYRCESDGGCAIPGTSCGEDGFCHPTTAPDAGAADAGPDGGGPEDAGTGTAACGSTDWADALSDLDGGAWLVFRDSSNGSYPQVDVGAEGPAVSFVKPGAYSSLGTVWIATPVQLAAFDLTFRASVTCGTPGACSDGFVVAWLEAAAAGPATLATSTSTATFGLPRGLSGSAIAFDVHEDPACGDPPAPAVSVLRLDGGVPGTYDWHVASAPVASLEGAHDVRVSVREGVAEVRLDGAVVVVAPVQTGFTGYVGLGASAGAQLGTFTVKDFAARFYACDAP